MNHDKLSAIEERLKAVEGNDLFDPIRVVKKCLVPKDFRVLDFIKYNRLECSNPNLWSYYNKMDEMIYNDKMLIYFFQDSLTRSILCWYMRLDNTKIKKWKELVESFLKQYKFNLEISFHKTSLMTLEKGNQESVRVYMQRCEMMPHISILLW
jgi:hypothetical protein